MKFFQMIVNHVLNVQVTQELKMETQFVYLMNAQITKSFRLVEDVQIVQQELDLIHSERIVFGHQ